MDLLVIISGIAVAISVVVFLTPKFVRYTEEITIDASVAQIYDHIRFQKDLMRWSAWPSETGSTCECQQEDGGVGAQTVFFDKEGKRIGHQEVTAISENKSVDFELFGGGPPHKAKMQFELIPINATRTKVLLHFTNEIMPPFNLVLRLVGVVSWTRKLHQKDLDGLKRFSEPPFQIYTGQPASISGTT
ncbi:SRPBCC family protein [Chamaesiphon sp.]|uniref:SRPBCC family protein n=1 Tax=Chamaesiphon sp. TaxID=2814140 RepID=UPI003593D720